MAALLVNGKRQFYAQSVFRTKHDLSTRFVESAKARVLLSRWSSHKPTLRDKGGNSMLLALLI